MDAKTELQQIDELLALLVNKDLKEKEIQQLQTAYDQGFEKAADKELPTAPVQPKAPKKPKKPKHVEADTKVKGKEMMMGMGYASFLFKTINKKKIINKAQEENDRMDREYAEAMEKYDRAYQKWEKDTAAYETAYAQWQKDVEAKTQMNREQFQKDNASQVEKINQLKAEVVELEKAIAASTILADRDKHIALVNNVSMRMSSKRADSLMMALNMYDEEVRRDQEFRARMQVEAMNRRMENEERSRREAQQQMEQLSHNQRMESLARDRLREERRAADELEEIRKATERMERK